jgi:hypothetical protein
MYKIRITTTVEQLDHDGRVLFSVTDTVDESSLGHGGDLPDQGAAFGRGMTSLSYRMAAVIREYFSRNSRATA